MGVVSRDEIEQSDDVVYLVVDELIRAVNEWPVEEQVDFVRGLSAGRRMVWGTFMVDGEVNNGGFNQFFWNSSSDFVDEARGGYRLIGAIEHLGLLEEAVARYEQHFDKLRPFYERNTIEAFSESYNDDLFRDLDDRFYELDSHDLISTYIRSHPDEFVGES